MKDYVAIDIETTGLSPAVHEIISVAAWRIRGSVIVNKYYQGIRPVRYVSLQVQGLTGLTNEMLASCRSAESVLPEFAEFCGKDYLLGHNLPFDYTFLMAKLKPMGKDFTLSKSRMGIDTCAVCKKLIRGSHKLEDLVERFHLLPEGGFLAHRADYDSYATHLLYQKLLWEYDTVQDVEFPKLLDNPVECYGEATDHGELPL